VYQETYQDTPQPMVVDKGKQKEEVIQDKEMFLYKLYTISSEPNRPTTPKHILLKEQVNNLENVIGRLNTNNFIFLSFIFLILY